MPSGESLISQANLNMGRGGGNRHAGKQKIIKVIRECLFEALSDAEVRVFNRLEQGADFTDWHREQAANEKSVRVYKAIIAGWTDGIKGRLGDDGLGGQNIGGIVRVWSDVTYGIELTAMSNWDEPIKAAPEDGGLGLPIYQRVTFDNGYYAIVSTVYKSVNPPGVIWLSSGYGLAGPLEDSGPFEFSYIAVSDGLPRYVSISSEYMRHGTRSKADGLTRAWFYVDPRDGDEYRVKWVCEKYRTPKSRIKSRPLFTYVLDLNGVVVGEEGAEGP